MTAISAQFKELCKYYEPSSRYILSILLIMEYSTEDELKICENIIYYNINTTGHIDINFLLFKIEKPVVHNEINALIKNSGISSLKYL